MHVINPSRFLRIAYILRCIPLFLQVSSESFVCSCREGHWGLACQYDCPGGARSPCSNNGLCNMTTGLCSCDPNWRGDENCTTCSPGWYGLDCSVITQSPNNRTAAAFAYGYIITLDGAGYRFLGNGEYHLILSQSFEVQARMVTCFSTSSCFNALAVRIEQHTLLVHGRFAVDEEPVIFLNGKRTYSLEFNFGPDSHKFTFKRTSRLQFILSSVYGVHLIIRLYDRYLDIHMRIDNQTYCQATQGLWGNCNYNAFDDLSSRKGDVITRQNVTQSYLHELYGRTWQVVEKDSLFIYNFNAYQEHRQLFGGGYALFLNNTGAHTGAIFSFSSPDITIEFMVRAESENGTLISYTTTRMFAVVLESGKIKIRYEDTILDTLAVIQLHKWNQIAVVWSKSTLILQFYHLNDAGIAHSRNFPITSRENVFEPGGILALGYCQPAPAGLRIPLKEGFIGQIDELRIWNQKLDPLSISTNLRRNMDCKTPVQNLASLWKFNEGYGTVAYDCVSSVHITFQTGIWHGPSWVFSTADVQQFSVDVLSAYSFRFGDKWMNAERKCFDLLFQSSVGSQYSMLGSATLWFYHMSCVAAITRSSHVSYAYSIIMAVSDFYYLFDQDSSWYAQRLCGHESAVNFPNWYGVNCAKHCRFGFPQNDSCVCMKGFHGVNCSEECPGGYHSPCGGHQPCSNITGKCSCPVAANITNDCSLCSPGWIGSDCSVALGRNGSSSDNYTCQGFGAAHYITFDGAGYGFATYGEFYLMKSNKFTTQVRQIPCMSRSFCISSVAVETGSSSIAIRASHDGSGNALVWFNRKLTGTTTIDLENNFRFHRIAPNTYEIGNKGPATILLRVKVWQKYLSFELTSVAQLCTVSSGLCSSCDSNVENDFTNSTGTKYWGQRLSQHEIIAIFSSQWRVSISQSLFLFGFTSYREQRGINSNGYALQFNGTLASSGALHTSFVKGQDFTLQLFVRVHAYGGTIICYAKEFTFAIVNDPKATKIYVGKTKYDLRIALPLGTWTQVSIAYSSPSGNIMLNSHFIQTNFSYRTLSVIDKSSYGK